MSESLDREIEVPELTAEEIEARVLHRDGLMLVIDKPAGLPVHRGPKGGANLESSFDALRFGLPRPPVLAHRLARRSTRCLGLGRRPQSTPPPGPLFQARTASKHSRPAARSAPGGEERHPHTPPGPPHARGGQA